MPEAVRFPGFFLPRFRDQTEERNFNIFCENMPDISINYVQDISIKNYPNIEVM